MPTPLLLLLLSVALLALLPPPTTPLNIALHAQSSYSKFGWVAGSEITTRGLKAAFESLPAPPGTSGHTATIFAPFDYAGLTTSSNGDPVTFDLLIIEGFIGTVPTVIATLRSHNPSIIILHYCLDTYPHIANILSLDVDAFLTNSVYLADSILPSYGFAAHHLLLAVDTDAFMGNAELSSSGGSIDIVYVGQYSPNKSNLLSMLTEAAQVSASRGFTFAIYGHAWGAGNGYDHLLPYYRGILPLEDLAQLYASTPVVLGTTESKQEELGMVNNRVFEVLACSTNLVVSEFDALHQLFGVQEEAREVGVHYVREAGDTEARILEILAKAPASPPFNAPGRSHVALSHSWVNRAHSILEFVEGGTFTERVNRPQVVLIYDGRVGGSEELGFWRNNLQAVHDAGDVDFMLVDWSESGSNIVFNKVVDLVVVRGTFGGEAETFVRQLGEEEVKRKGFVGVEGGGMGSGLLINDHYDIVGWDLGVEAGSELSEHPNTFPMEDTSADFVKQFSYAVLSRTVNLPMKSAKIALTSVSTDPSDAVGHLDATVAHWYVHLRVRLTDFNPPESGVWCVWVNGEQAKCVGDLNGGSRRDGGIDSGVSFSMEEFAGRGQGVDNDEFWVSISLNAGGLEYKEVVYEVGEMLQYTHTGN